MDAPLEMLELVLKQVDSLKILKIVRRKLIKPVPTMIISISKNKNTSSNFYHFHIIFCNLGS